ncbi:MAG: hypothetical protein ABI605_10925 [Rhizobacter sp.]
MQLTATQKITFKAALLAETDPALAQLRSDNNTGAMADWYNGATTFIVWNSRTPADDIYNSINWKNFTPSDAADGTLLYQNRVGKTGLQQDSLTMLLKHGFASTIDMSKPKISSGIQDALTDIPTGAGGALQQGGWNTVKTISVRPATRAEKIFATGTGSAGSPGTNGPEGYVSNEDVLSILAVVP